MATTRVASAGTYNSGDLISAADLNAMPGGTIGRDELSTNSGGTSTIEIACSVTPTVGDSREVTIHCTANYRATGACNCQLGIYEDSVQIQRKMTPIPAAATDVTITTFVTSYPVAGSHQYDLATGASGSTSETVTCVNNGGGSNEGVTVILVVDTGPSF